MITDLYNKILITITKPQQLKKKQVYCLVESLQHEYTIMKKKGDSNGKKL
jgi:hypothetical protein